MRLTIIFIVFFLIIEKKEANLNSCYDQDPTELKWLNQLIENYTMSMAIQAPSIYEYSYNDSVFFTSERDDLVLTVYSCEGEITCSHSYSDKSCLTDFKENAKRIKKIWPD